MKKQKMTAKIVNTYFWSSWSVQKKIGAVFVFLLAYTYLLILIKTSYTKNEILERIAVRAAKAKRQMANVQLADDKFMQQLNETKLLCDEYALFVPGCGNVTDSVSTSSTTIW